MIFTSTVGVARLMPKRGDSRIAAYSLPTSGIERFVSFLGTFRDDAVSHLSVP